MVISYERTIDDMVTFSLYDFKHSVNRIQRLILSYGIPILAIFITTIYFIEGATAIKTIAWLFIIFPYLIISFSFSLTLKKFIFKRMYSKEDYEKHRCKHWLTINPDAMIETSDFGECKERWCGIHEIVFTDKHIFVYCLPHQAYIIPNRAFNNESVQGEFIETMSLYFDNAQE